MKNIVLIGMPAVGKSTIGVLLAKSLLLSFTDTDLLIQEKYKKSLCDIIKDNGTKAFLDIEENVILEAEFKNSVIATGGSAVFGEKAMKKLKENGVVIVGSNHDFAKTPEKDEIVKRLVYMKEVGADLPKIAVMPKTEADVEALLLATTEAAHFLETPII